MADVLSSFQFQWYEFKVGHPQMKSVIHSRLRHRTRHPVFYSSNGLGTADVFNKEALLLKDKRQQGDGLRIASYAPTSGVD